MGDISATASSFSHGIAGTVRRVPTLGLMIHRIVADGCWHRSAVTNATRPASREAPDEPGQAAHRQLTHQVALPASQSLAVTRPSEIQRTKSRGLATQANAGRRERECRNATVAFLANCMSERYRTVELNALAEAIVEAKDAAARSRRWPASHAPPAQDLRRHRRIRSPPATAGGGYPTSCWATMSL